MEESNSSDTKIGVLIGLGVVALIFGWVGFTFFINRYNVDDFFLRLVVLLKLFAIGGMAVSAPAVFAGEPELFAWTFAAVQLVFAVLYFRAYRQVPEAADYSRYWGSVFAMIPAKPAWAIST